MKRNLFIASLVGALASAAAVIGQVGWLDFRCETYQYCRAVPTCPNPTGECDSCTAYAFHEQCDEHLTSTCTPRNPEEGGCGFVRHGTCDPLIDKCTFVITDEVCHRDDCQ